MDVDQLIIDLKVYKGQLDEAIAVLERLAHGRGGKTPSKAVSSDTRKRMAAAQRKRWSAYRKAKAI